MKQSNVVKYIFYESDNILNSSIGDILKYLAKSRHLEKNVAYCKTLLRSLQI